MNEKAFGAIEWFLDTTAEGATNAGYGPWVEQASKELANARKLLEAAKKIKPCRRTIAMDIAIRDCGVENNA